MVLVSLRNVSFNYPGGATPAISGITLDVRRGEFLAVLGGDEAGKTTLCKVLNGLIPHSTKGELNGEVRFFGQSVMETDVTKIVRRIGLCLQDPEMQLFTNSVEEEVAFGPENLGVAPDEIEVRITEALEAMGLTGLRKKSPNALSGGQKQRLSIAAILSMQPEMVILDEPLSMLDPNGRHELLELLRGMKAQRNMTIVVTEHSAEELCRYCDRIALISKGKLVSIGTPYEVLTSSKDLNSLDIVSPQLLELSERLVSEGLLSPDEKFMDEDGAVRALRRTFEEV